MGKKQMTTCEKALLADVSSHIPIDQPRAPLHGCVFKCIGSGRDTHFTSTIDKHGAYSRQGYEEIAKDGAKKARYGAFGALFLPNWRADPTRQFQSKFVPFNHQYHHMLPWEALQDAFSTGKSDTGPGQLFAIQQSEYNLNDGINLIVLPESPTQAALLGLPTHFKGHPRYSTSLAAMLIEVKQTLAPATHLVDSSNAPALKVLMESWEKQEFLQIASQGAAYPGQDIDSCPLVSMMVGGKIIKDPRF